MRRQKLPWFKSEHDLCPYCVEQAISSARMNLTSCYALRNTFCMYSPILVATAEQNRTKSSCMRFFIFQTKNTLTCRLEKASEYQESLIIWPPAHPSCKTLESSISKLLCCPICSSHSCLQDLVIKF